MKYYYYIGIDPGVNTGYALWSAHQKRFCYISSGTITEVMDWVKWLVSETTKNNVTLFVRVEDARKRKWFGPSKNPFSKLQGAGSVKRDCKMWEDFLTEQGIPFEMVDPKDMKGMTKVNAETFNKMTKWDKPTNEHSRDSAMLVLNK